jgi:aminoglycoside phosphotransferase (APT) family kinase protein
MEDWLPATLDPVDWRRIVNLDRLAAWMGGQGLEGASITSPSSIAGGTQNLLLKFDYGERQYVLRRAPQHSVAGGNRTIRRETRVLAALAHTDVPHPRLIAACDDETVMGAAFLLMEPIEGFNPVVGMPAPHATDPAVRRAMGFALIDGILALGRVDHVAVGLADFGRLEGYLERQASQWRDQYLGYAHYPGWTPASLPHIETIADWLTAHRPLRMSPGIVHGDYHLANVLYRCDGPELAAIVDWELASLGDPLLDLGWLLATWPDPVEVEATLPVTPWDGFPSDVELIARYAAGTERDLHQINWYKILACYKLGILLEGTHARALGGHAKAVTGERLHRQAAGLLERAIRSIENPIGAP